MAITRALSPSHLCMHATSSNSQNGSCRSVQVSSKSSCKWAVQEYLLGANFNGLTHNNQDGVYTKHARLVKDVKRALRTKGDANLLDSLALIDAVQRMGIEYHFEEEMESVLQKIYVDQSACFHKYQTPVDVSLCFRLLRQGGYYVPADVFRKFKNDDDGTFKLTLSQHVSGLIGMFEAAQLGVEGEPILDEVANFSREHLNACLARNGYFQARVIKDTLNYPYHRCLASYKAKSFISNFKGINGWGRSTLQELSNIDYSIAQQIHHNELSQVSRWWSSLGLAEELTLLRDQPLKWYAGPMALLTDPRLSQQRIDLAKCISFIYVIDDIFDVYGTVQELTLFTEAVNRWDLAAMADLPEYMRSLYRSLYDTINAIGFSIHKSYGWNPTETLRKTWSSLCNAFLKEATWFASGVLPTADEYLQNGLVSSGAHVLSAHMFYLLGLGLTNESSVHLEDLSGMISSGAKILRLWDDLGSAKDENQDGNDGSYIECLVKGNENLSFELARDHVVKLIEDEWKQLNKEHLCLSRSSRLFTKAFLNAARMVPLMYSYDDKQSIPLLQEYIKSMLHDDLSISMK